MRRGICHMHGTAYVGDKMLWKGNSWLKFKKSQLMNQPLAYVNPQAKLRRTWLLTFVCIDKKCSHWRGNLDRFQCDHFWKAARIGKNCRIFPGAVISAVPQDLKFIGEDTIVKIGNNTTIREFVTINRGTKASYETVVGDNTLLMAYVHVAHDCIIGNNVIMGNAAMLAGHVTLDDWAIIGAMVPVHQFCRIGHIP